MMRPVDFDLYLVTDRNQTRGRDLLEVLKEALDGGVDAVQLREKDLNARDLFFLAEAARKLTQCYRSRLLINDRIDVALAVDADGVQLGIGSIPITTAREILGTERFIGASIHALSEAYAAQHSGADFLVFGPVYFTPSKVPYGTPQGLAPLEEVVEKISLPVYAIGGIKLDKIDEVMRTGARGIALISAIVASDRPNQTTRRFLAMLRR